MSINLLAQKSVGTIIGFDKLIIYEDSTTCNSKWVYKFGQKDSVYYKEDNINELFVTVEKYISFDNESINSISMYCSRINANGSYRCKNEIIFPQKKYYKCQYIGKTSVLFNISFSKYYIWYTPKQLAYLYISRKNTRKYKKWAKNGQLVACYKYKGDKRVGWHKLWRENGDLWYTLKYDKEGVLKEVNEYKDGKLENFYGAFLEPEERNFYRYLPREAEILLEPARCYHNCNQPKLSPEPIYNMKKK